MNTYAPPPIGMQLENGIYIGRINVNGSQKGILLPPKATRQYPELIVYNNGPVKGATSWNDGQANTRDMAASGSKLAQWALDINMHIPSMDELEIIYRACKPTTDKNSSWMRSGINLSAIPPTWPYTKDFPAQTTLEQFKAGGAEAFDTHDWYWSSTRHPVNEDYAYAQYFDHGNQDGWTVDGNFLGVAVRWIDL